jgi:hypothetical protein
MSEKQSWKTFHRYRVVLPAKATLVYEVEACSHSEAIERCRRGEIEPTGHELLVPGTAWCHATTTREQR